MKINARVIVTCLWLIAAGGGAIWLVIQSNSPLAQAHRGWRAARDLVPNDQVEDVDIEGPKLRYQLSQLPPKDKLVGKYVKRQRKKGDLVNEFDVEPRPHFEPCEPRSGVWIESLDNETFLAPGLRLGTWVIPCSVTPESGKKDAVTKCAKNSLLVEAVHRPVAKGDSTWVALRVPNCRTVDVGRYLAAKTRFLLLAANPPPLSEQACPHH